MRTTIRYLLLEGYIIGDAQCTECGNKWMISIEPEKIPPTCRSGKVKLFSVKDQPCIKCGGLSVLMSITGYLPGNA